MKKLLIAVAIGCVWFQAQAAELNWGTDLPKALAQAKAEKKMVLLDFTGSDWCGWCIKFKGEVLDTKAFKDYAEKNLVLVEVDFPNKKVLSAEQKKANAALKEKYGVKGYPTYVVLNAEGKEIGRQGGYAPGGPSVFIAKLEKFSKP